MQIAAARYRYGFLFEFSKRQTLVAQNGKRRTYYRITAAGMAHYRQKCREWQLTKDVVGRFLEGSVE